MSCSPLKEIFSDEFVAFVVEQITFSEWKQFFVQLGFDTNECDHWEHDYYYCLNEAFTSGLKKWSKKPLKEKNPCDKNIEELKAWIFAALNKCKRHDLVDDLTTSNQDIDKIIDTLSEKVTKERSRLYAFLGIDPDEDDQTMNLKKKTETALKTWLQRQGKKFWKYQELLHAFDEQKNRQAIDEIVEEFDVKECRIRYQESKILVPINCGKIDLPTPNKRSFDISKTGIQEEPLTKKFKNDQILETKVSAATITGPEPSTSGESGSVTVTDDLTTQEIIYIRSEYDHEAKDQHEAKLNLAKESDTYSLRDYQQELEELALKGHNTIICAGTNSGKTYIALHIIEKHLNKNSKGTIAFLTRTNVLLDQQFELACKLLPRLNCNGKIRKLRGDQEFTSETFRNLVKTSSIIFLTPQSLCNFLDQDTENTRVEMNQFTLLVLDECHHTYGKTPYNDIMRHYRKLKYGEKPTPRPQILGLTASPGTNRAKHVLSAKDNLKLIMANLDVSKLSVVQKYEASLLKHTSIPEKVYILSTKRQKDPVTDLLLKAMDKVENVFDCRLVNTFLRDPVNKADNIRNALCYPPADRKTVRFLQWVAETRMKVEEITTNQSTIPRLLHACLRHLEFYVECLDINSLLDIIDVRAVLNEGYMRLKEESDKATEQKEKDLVKILEEVYLHIFELGRRIERNPDIGEIIQFLEEQYEKFKDESRFLVFVKTRRTAMALAEKMPEHFKSRYLTGSQNSKAELGLCREEQTDIVARFRDGKHICVVATSVAAEGLDIPKCNVVIKYRLFPNEISSLQMRGRVRQKGGKDVIVGSQEEFQKEDINVERQYLMQEAIQLVLKEDITEEISTKERNIFQIEDKERKRQKLNLNEKNKGQFYVRCKKCSNDSIIADGQVIRRINNTHSIVCDKAIFSTIRRKIQGSKPIWGQLIEKSDKVLGSDCGHFWGSILIYQECEFVTLSQDSVQIIEKETKQSLGLKKWSEVNAKFLLDNITDAEVIKYRSQPTPSLPI